MEEKKSYHIISSTFSLNALGFLTWLVFLILKVTGTWDLDWFWVWFPFWLPWAIDGASLIGIGLLAFIVYLINSRRE